MIADEISRRAKPNALNPARKRHETTVRPRDCSRVAFRNTALNLVARSLLERVTRIKLALAAWESVPSGPVTWPDLRDGLSASDRRDRSSPGLMAR